MCHGGVDPVQICTGPETGSWLRPSHSAPPFLSLCTTMCFTLHLFSLLTAPPWTNNATFFSSWHSMVGSVKIGKSIISYILIKRRDLLSCFLVLTSLEVNYKCRNVRRQKLHHFLQRFFSQKCTIVLYLCKYAKK